MLFLLPPSHEHNSLLQLGIGYLGAVAEAAGCEVRALDAAARYRKLTIDDLLKEVDEFRPHVVGVQVVVNFMHSAYELIDRLGGRGLLVIAGGPHAQACTDDVLTSGADFVARGEGEETFRQFIEFVRGTRAAENVEGLSRAGDGGAPIHNALAPLINDLDTIPFPKRSLFPAETYWKGAKGFPQAAISHMFTSRGCVFKCAYCISGGAFGKRYRFRSAENVLEEIRQIHRDYGTTFFLFSDDAFTVQRKRTRELLRGFREELDFKIEWACSTMIEFTDAELLDIMAESGCRLIGFGVESGNPETWKAVRKKIRLEKLEEVFRMVVERGIGYRMNYMFGFPEEGAAEIRNTTAFIEKHFPPLEKMKPESAALTGVAAQILIPYPGTEVYEKYKDEHGFAEWWKTYRTAPMKNDRDPFFRGFRYFYELEMAGQKYFFKHPPEVRRANLRAIYFVDMLNFSRKRGAAYARVMSALSRLSFTIYKVSPALERRVMDSLMAAITRAGRLLRGRRANA